MLGKLLITAVLDSGCKTNVCGNIWMTCYLDTTKSDDLRKVETRPSSTTFKFKNGTQVKSQKLTKVHSIVGGKNTFIKTDVVVCDIPFLLSKDAIKKAEMNIDFVTDTVKIFGLNQKLLLISQVIVRTPPPL